MSICEIALLSEILNFSQRYSKKVQFQNFPCLIWVIREITCLQFYHLSNSRCFQGFKRQYWGQEYLVQEISQYLTFNLNMLTPWPWTSLQGHYPWLSLTTLYQISPITLFSNEITLNRSLIRLNFWINSRNRITLHPIFQFVSNWKKKIWPNFQNWKKFWNLTRQKLFC